MGEIINVQNNKIIKPGLTKTGSIVLIAIPKVNVIEFILNHSKNLIGFMPLFDDVSMDPDVANLPSIQVNYPITGDNKNEKSNS